LTPTIPLNPVLPTSVILGNGTFPEWLDIRQILNRYNAALICADGGSEKARELGLIPQVIVGDLDSITPETLSRFRSAGVEIIHTPDQEDNDLEKCLRLLLTRGGRQFILAGFTGRRDDQTIATLQIARKYISRAQFLIYTKTAEMYLLNKGNWLFETISGQIISLFGFPRARQVTTAGLQFPLQAEILSGGSRGLSNVARGSVVQISFSGGHLLVVKIQEFL